MIGQGLVLGSKEHYNDARNRSNRGAGSRMKVGMAIPTAERPRRRFSRWWGATLLVLEACTAFTANDTGHADDDGGEQMDAHVDPKETGRSSDVVTDAGRAPARRGRSGGDSRSVAGDASLDVPDEATDATDNTTDVSLEGAPYALDETRDVSPEVAGDATDETYDVLPEVADDARDETGDESESTDASDSSASEVGFSGDFEASPWFCLTGQDCRVADLDNDGFDDLIVFTRTGPVWVAFGTGTSFDGNYQRSPYFCVKVTTARSAISTMMGGPTRLLQQERAGVGRLWNG